MVIGAMIPFPGYISKANQFSVLKRHLAAMCIATHFTVTEYGNNLSDHQ